MKRVGAYGTELFERDGKKFAKFFLISDARNLKGWQVAKASIPKRIRTFIGRPFVSEPGLAHFGADNMSLNQVLVEQERFRAGTIVDVTQDPVTNIAAAIVEFANNNLGNSVWSELQQGKAIYVSPAVAGTSVNQNGTSLFTDWFGLHLARVDSPAYGVFHASIKATCEGDERKCVEQLIASASVLISSNDSFNFAGFSCSKDMMSSTSQITSTAQTEDEKKKLMEENASLKQQIASITKEVADIKEKMKGTAFEPLGNDDTENKPEPSMQGQTTPVTDPITDTAHQKNASGKGKGTASETEQLKAQIAQLQADQKAKVASEILEMEKNANLFANSDEENKREKELASLDLVNLKKEQASVERFTTKIASLLERTGYIQDTENRIIKQVASGSADNHKPTSLNDIKDYPWVSA